MWEVKNIEMERGKEIKRDRVKKKKNEQKVYS